MAIEGVSVSGKRYTDEFKIEAVRQVTEHGRRVVKVAMQDLRMNCAPQRACTHTGIA